MRLRLYSFLGDKEDDIYIKLYDAGNSLIKAGYLGNLRKEFSQGITNRLFDIKIREYKRSQDNGIVEIWLDVD